MDMRMLVALTMRPLSLQVPSQTRMLSIENHLNYCIHLTVRTNMSITQGTRVTFTHGHSLFPYVGKGIVSHVYTTDYGKAYDVVCSGATSHVTPGHPNTPNASVTAL